MLSTLLIICLVTYLVLDRYLSHASALAVALGLFLLVRMAAIAGIY
jgi:hypothetical protein